jgi:hypothetical protein
VESDESTSSLTPDLVGNHDDSIISNHHRPCQAFHLPQGNLSPP